MDQIGFPPAESSQSPALQPATPLVRVQAWAALAATRGGLTTVPTQFERTAA